MICTVPRPPRKRPGTAGIFAQGVTFDNQRVFRFDLLGRAVVGITVIDRDGRVDAVFGFFRTPATTDHAADVDK